MISYQAIKSEIYERISAGQLTDDEGAAVMLIAIADDRVSGGDEPEHPDASDLADDVNAWLDEVVT